MEDVIKKKDGFKGQKAIVIPSQILSKQCEKNKLISTLYITDIGYYPKAKFHFRERPFGAEQHILIFCQKGSGTSTIDGEEFKIEAGNFFIIPVNTPHMYAADEKIPWTIYWIHFKGSLSANIISRIKNQIGLSGFLKYSEKSLGLFEEMYNQLERGYGNDNLMYSNMCLWHFLTTFLFNDKYAPENTLVHKGPTEIAIDFLKNNVHKSLSLETIAGTVNLSPSHFSYLFKKETGFSPIEYFNQLKIQKACQYLLFTDLRIKEISQELGIEDQYYFSRLFTKMMGLSPIIYKEKKLH